MSRSLNPTDKNTNGCNLFLIHSKLLAGYLSIEPAEYLSIVPFRYPTIAQDGLY